MSDRIEYERRTPCVSQVQALKLQELRAAINAGVASGPGVDADAVFDRLTQKYQAAADSGKRAT